MASSAFPTKVVSLTSLNLTICLSIVTLFTSGRPGLSKATSTLDPGSPLSSLRTCSTVRSETGLELTERICDGV